MEELQGLPIKREKEKCKGGVGYHFKTGKKSINIIYGDKTPEQLEKRFAVRIKLQLGTGEI